MSVRVPPAWWGSGPKPRQGSGPGQPGSGARPRLPCGSLRSLPSASQTASGGRRTTSPWRSGPQPAGLFPSEPSGSPLQHVPSVSEPPLKKEKQTHGPGAACTPRPTRPRAGGERAAAVCLRATRGRCQAHCEPGAWQQRSPRKGVMATPVPTFGDLQEPKCLPGRRPDSCPTALGTPGTQYSQRPKLDMQPPGGQSVTGGHGRNPRCPPAAGSGSARRMASLPPHGSPAGTATRRGPGSWRSPSDWYTTRSNPSMTFLREEGSAVSACGGRRRRSRPRRRPHPISRFLACSASQRLLSCRFSFCIASTCTKHTPLEPGAPHARGERQVPSGPQGPVPV